MPRFSVHDAKIRLSELIAKALAGEDVVITRSNVPAVRLEPIAPRGKRRFGALKGKIAIDGRLQDPLVHGGDKTIQRSAGIGAGAGGVKVVHWIG